MRVRIDIILLNALWLVVFALFSSFWFDLQFGFNIFSSAHWHYLGAAQVGAAKVSSFFYASLIAFGFVLVFGLYLINRPHRRKIRLNETESKATSPINSSLEILGTPDTQNQQPTTNAQPRAAAVPRPPRLNAAPHLMAAAPTPTQAPAPQKALKNTVGILDELFIDAGYSVKAPPKVSGIQLDLLAVGMDEVLYSGIVCAEPGDITAAEGGNSKWKTSAREFESPAWRISQAASAMRTLFSETLDNDIKITVRPFVVMDGGTIANRASLEKIWEAFEVQVFNSIAALREYLQKNPNRETPESEQEDFDAYSEYIDTVSDYFNKNSGNAAN